MASPQELQVATQEPTVDERPMPEMAPPLTNPPVPADEAAQARAALGGPAAAFEAPRHEPIPEAPAAEEAAAHAAKPNASRFTPPQELDFEFTPPERPQLRNNNIPLTIGLLFSIVAAFIVFLVSLAGNTAGDDPIMPSFWRALGALAVLMTLSFTASWFMPAPSNHRVLLDQLDAEEDAMRDRYGSRVRPQPVVTPEPGPEPAAAEPAKGTSVDLTIADEEEDDDTAGFDDEAEDDDEDEDDFEDDEDVEEEVAAERTIV